MCLILSSDRPRNSTYATESGHILYQVDNPCKTFSEGTATICKAVWPFQGQFVFYGQIEFHAFHSTRLRFNGFEVSVNNYFHKAGLFSMDKIFRASDGKEYRWKLETNTLKLVRNEGNKLEVAKFKESKPSFGPFSKGRPASLEVEPSVEQILDEIVLTFIYCHKLKEDNKKSTEIVMNAATSVS
ncbi:hypothetical protein AN958_02250 [Leucoagaricus sp. SymC.cos]|nr:hypothetical protein AN958_02250 [Leucoagaricus sp. SymC.cos]